MTRAERRKAFLAKFKGKSAPAPAPPIAGPPNAPDVMGHADRPEYRGDLRDPRMVAAASGLGRLMMGA